MTDGLLLIITFKEIDTSLRRLTPTSTVRARRVQEGFP
jgi:hypothetical protein